VSNYTCNQTTVKKTGLAAPVRAADTDRQTWMNGQTGHKHTRSQFNAWQISHAGCPVF